MNAWRIVISIAAIALIFVLCPACGSIEPELNSETTIEPQRDTEPTHTAVEQGSDLAEQETSEPRQGAEGAKPTFDPENTKDGMAMVFIPAGEFEMGTSPEERDQLLKENVDWKFRDFTLEQPKHTVYLDAFWIDQTEVTNGQYALCVADGACEEPHLFSSNTRPSYYENPEFEDFPVTYVDWIRASAYCAWAGRRLPTEAEWEKAARGTDSRTFPWGEGTDTSLANYGGERTGNLDTVAVGSFPSGASPYGVLDMAGNVWEWVFDVFDNRYYFDSPLENPQGPPMGTFHGIRGGSWDGTTNAIRAAIRYRYRETYVDFPSGGFRCAASP